MAVLCLGACGPVARDGGGGEAALEEAALEQARRALGPDPRNEAMFDEHRVVDFHLTITPEEWTKFLSYRARGVKEWVHCSFSFEGQTFADAACRSKGDERVWPDEPKPEWMISFDKWDKAGRFHGLRRLNLEANPYTNAPVRDRVGMWLMRQAGLIAPRVNHARVFLNGQYLGLYQNLEIIDEEFLKARFARPGGNLYEDGHKLVTNKSTGDQTRLWDLENLIEAEPLTGDHSRFYAELQRLMDVHQALREMAVEAALPTPDNFSNGSTNFYFYDDPDRGFVVLPWDLDDIIGEFAPPDASAFDYWGGSINNEPNKLRLLMNQHPDWHREYVDALVALRDGPYSSLAARTAEVCAQIRADVQADPNKVEEDIAYFDQDCADIQAIIQARITYLRRALGR
jgi:spore coat protein CotH